MLNIHFMGTITTLALGSWPRQGVVRLQEKGEPRVMPHVPGSARECEGTNPHTLKGTPTLGSWSPDGLSNFQNAIARVKTQSSWINFYIIRNLLKRRCLKWACMTHLDIWNTSYGQKKGRESNWQFDSQPQKVRNWSNFLACRWHATCRWKALNKGYTFALNLITIRSLHTKW
jgi:hypothetical protein